MGILIEVILDLIWTILEFSLEFLFWRAVYNMQTVQYRRTEEQIIWSARRREVLTSVRTGASQISYRLQPSPRMSVRRSIMDMLKVA